MYALVTPTVWAEKGELRAAVQVMLPTAGIGKQQLNREKVRAALEKDGLLDPSRKRSLPTFPRAIAVVTSADGAALRDIIIVTRKPGARCGLVLGPTVQGDGAPRREPPSAGPSGWLNRLSGIDLCIIGRGGGSKDDLNAFDDEKVAGRRAALGVPRNLRGSDHETDASLTDLVPIGGLRLPSACRELAVPDSGGLCPACALALLAPGPRTPPAHQPRWPERLARSGDRIQVAMMGGHSGAAGAARSLRSRAARGPEPLRYWDGATRWPGVSDGRVARRRADLPSGTEFTLRVSDGEVPSRAD